MRVRKSTSIPGRVGAENSDLATLKIRSLMISIYFRNIYKLIIIKWSIYSLNYIKNYVFLEKFLRVGRSATFPGRVGTDPTCVPGRSFRPGKIRSLSVSFFECAWKPQLSVFNALIRNIRIQLVNFVFEPRLATTTP